MRIYLYTFTFLLFSTLLIGVRAQDAGGIVPCQDLEVNEDDDTEVEGVPVCVPLSLSQFDPSRSTYFFSGRTLGQGDTDLYLVDLRGIAIPHMGVSLHVFFNPHNQFAENVNSLLRLRAHEYPTTTEYSHVGGWRVQLAPHETEAVPYYVSVTNVLNGHVAYDLEFSLDAPIPISPNLPFEAFGQQSNGMKEFDWPRQMNVQLKEHGGRFEEHCDKETSTSHQDVYQCFQEYLSTAVNSFYGTVYPVCKAQAMLQNGYVRDCRYLAHHVGSIALSSSFSNVYEAYAMCADGVCLDGCKHGVLEQWTTAFVTNDDFELLVADICVSFGEPYNVPCIQGVGGGLILSGFSLVNALVKCEHLAQVSAGTKILREAWQKECYAGVYRRYLDTQALTLDETKYKQEFVNLCAEAKETSSMYHTSCLRSLGANAGFRAHDDELNAYAYCNLLKEDTLLKECIKGLNDYLKAINEWDQKNAPCSRLELHSTIQYNLPIFFSEGNEVILEQVKRQEIDWMNTYNNTIFTLNDVRPADKEQRYWWFSIDPNRAMVPFSIEVLTDPPAEGYDEETADSLGIAGAIIVFFEAAFLWWMRRRVRAHEEQEKGFEAAVE